MQNSDCSRAFLEDAEILRRNFRSPPRFPGHRGSAILYDADDRGPGISRRVRAHCDITIMIRCTSGQFLRNKNNTPPPPRPPNITIYYDGIAVVAAVVVVQDEKKKKQ